MQHKHTYTYLGDYSGFGYTPIEEAPRGESGIAFLSRPEWFCHRDFPPPTYHNWAVL
jgi:hypothetical protein